MVSYHKLNPCAANGCQVKSPVNSGLPLTGITQNPMCVPPCRHTTKGWRIACLAGEYPHLPKTWRYAKIISHRNHWMNRPFADRTRPGFRKETILCRPVITVPVRIPPIPIPRTLPAPIRPPALPLRGPRIPRPPALRAAGHLPGARAGIPPPATAAGPRAAFRSRAGHPGRRPAPV